MDSLTVFPTYYVGTLLQLVPPEHSLTNAVQQYQSHKDTMFLNFFFIKLLTLTYLIVQPKMIWIN